MPHPLAVRLVLAVIVAALAGCGGGGGSASSTPTAAPATRAVTTWWDADRLRPQSTGAIAVDPAGTAKRDAAGAEVKVGEWTWYYDADGSPVRRVERFGPDGRSLGWTEYNADAIDPVTRRGSVRDDAADGIQR